MAAIIVLSLLLIISLIAIFILYLRWVKPTKQLRQAVEIIDFNNNSVDFTLLDSLQFTGNKDIQVIHTKCIDLTNIVCDRINKVNEAIDNGSKDGLTGCLNMAYLNQHKSEYENCNDFTIIFIDVNNLKRMNDEFGHEAGDALLKNATKKLKFWRDYGDVYRVGGDEFMIVITDTTVKRIKEWIGAWYPRTGMLNRDSDGFKCVLSYGVARGTRGDDFDKIRNIADERMYDMKVKLKQKFGEPMR